jgi:hypothetical protein
VVDAAGALREVAPDEHLADGLRGQHTADHAGVDPLSGEGVGLAGGVSDGHELPGRAPLDAPQAQGCDADRLPELHLGSEGAPDEGVVLDLLPVEIAEAIRSHGTAGDRVAAEVDVVVVVSKQRHVARQDVAGIEEHAAGLEIVAAALHILPARHSLGRGLHHAQRARQSAGRPVGGHQHPGPKAPAVAAANGPEAVAFQLGPADGGALHQIRAHLRRTERDALVAEDALDGVAAGAWGGASLAGAHVALARGRDEAARRGVANQALGLQLLQDAHLLQDLESGGAPGVAAVLVPRKASLLEQRHPPSGSAPRARRQGVGGGGAGGTGTHHDHVVGAPAHLGRGIGVHVGLPVPRTRRLRPQAPRSGARSEPRASTAPERSRAADSL